MGNEDYYSYVFDCDGVVLNSNKLKTECFRELLNKEKKEHVDLFIEYHVSNQGINRYEKLRYFFEKYGFRVCSRLADFFGNQI